MVLRLLGLLLLIFEVSVFCLDVFLKKSIVFERLCTKVTFQVDDAIVMGPLVAAQLNWPIN